MITKSLQSLNNTETEQGFLTLQIGAQRETREIGPFMTMGRDQANVFVIEDEFISTRHARIEKKVQGFILQDMRSRNGTYLNGGRINEAILKDGDRIRLGKTDILFTFRRDQSNRKLFLESKNKKWHAELSHLPSIAQSQLPVLLTGPSGTGKEVLAKMIHEFSDRRGSAFISVNCSALSESLVESELFGHIKGSFTGATHDRKGAFEAARGGTLFLDEIGDLPLTLQPKLLRALENKEIRPVGQDVPIKTDVRIVAATHQDLKRNVLQGKFRSDLYYRLNVVRIHPPALSERMEDFESLLYSFAKKYRIGFTFQAIEKLKTHNWPGNVRELKNLVARAKAYHGENKIEEHHIDDLIDLLPIQEPNQQTVFRPGGSVIKEIERELIKERLIANKGNQRRTANELGIPKSTLNDRLKSYEIDIDKLLKGGQL